MAGLGSEAPAEGRLAEAIMGEAVVAEARAWIGTPYLHQASCRGAGSDCLGLVRGIWRVLHGAEPCPVPPYTADWAEVARHEALLEAARHWLVPKAQDDAAPGDVLVFRMRPGGMAKHLGVQSACGVGGGGRFIHAYSGHHVTESALTAPWTRRIAARFRFPLKGE
ncbi:NlpC/P60 family protein [Pseudogemmobacter sonorensis]|uniref:NlpC/P60 family protein n=1 Tax=Pseudogemmobacter sonorensis TaxID=2989681 RepID=UPI00368B4520